MTLIGCKGNENKQADVSNDSIQSAGKNVYTCPMHPEIVSDTPATCPSCGMDLEIRS